MRDVRDDSDVAGLTPGTMVSLLLRLVGGKGGFGSLLRVQGRDTKATTNFEACRDLSGRRLRHVNATKKMEEWSQKANDRELEKIALRHVTQRAREQRQEKRKAIDPEEVTQLLEDTVRGVKKAVQGALETSQAQSNHRRHSKKPRFMLDDDEEEDESAEESDDVTDKTAASLDIDGSSHIPTDDTKAVLCDGTVSI